MNKTATKFGEFLKQKMFPMHIIKTKEEGNDTIFAFTQTIRSFEVNVVIDFDEDNTCIDLNILDIVKLSDNSNKENMYDVLNKINGSYRFPKFYINEENSVAAQITIPYENEVSADMIFDMLSSMMTFCNNMMDELSAIARN